jgi:protoporphyrinogen oxidase
VGVELMDGEVRRYSQIISTMPLTLMVRGLDDVPEHIRELSRSLRFRNTILVFLRVDADELFPDQWLYIHSSDLTTGRITNFRNWVPELYGQETASIIAMEFWCYDDDEVWTEGDDALIDRARQELIQTGLIGDAPIVDGMVYRVPRCYPVYDRGYRDRLKPIEQFLDGIDNLHVIGRYGAFKYNNQDHSILMGLLAAQNIVEQADNDLWEINTDYEAYQEASVITETGLVEKQPA